MKLSVQYQLLSLLGVLGCSVALPFDNRIEEMTPVINTDMVFSIGDYSLYKKEATWNEAYDTCKREGAHLLVIDHYNEVTLVKELINQFPKIEQFHVGVRYDVFTFKFLTVFGADLPPFFHWATPYFNSGENCASMDRNEKLHTVFCYQGLHPFICEKLIPLKF